MYLNIFRRFNNFFKYYKISFSIPKKIDLIFLDNNYSNISLKDLKFVYYKIEDKLQINIFILFLSFLNIFQIRNKNFTDIYFCKFIELHDPKIAIGHEFEAHIYRFKKFFPNRISIMYQTADYNNFYEKTAPKLISQNGKYNLKSDYLLCKNSFADKFLNFIDSKKIIVGSVRNNEIGELNDEKKKYDILFISEHRRNVSSYYGTNNNLGELTTAEATTSFILKILNDLVNKENKSVCLGLVSNRADKKKFANKSWRQNEIDFIKRDLEDFHIENENAYKLASKSKLIIAMRSTIGLELLSRGYKVLFLDSRAYLGGHPLTIISDKSDGPFWYFGQDRDIIVEKIKKVLELDNQEWIRLIKKYETIKFDPKNTILKKLINEKLNINVTEKL